MKVAVVGHVEWTEFVEVDHVPAPGQIAHGTELWAGPAGGGSVVAAQLLKLAGACDFYTALGEDDAGRRSLEQLEQLGLVVHPQWFGSTRRALTHVDQDEGADDHDGRAEAPAEGAASTSPATTPSSSSPATSPPSARREQPRSWPRRRASSRR